MMRLCGCQRQVCLLSPVCAWIYLRHLMATCSLCLGKVFIRCQSGWSPKVVWRVDIGLNSFLGLTGESFCAFSASLKSKSYHSNTLRLCLAPSAVKTKLNSGRDGVMQGVLMTAWIRWIKLLGQSKDGDSCESVSQASLSGVEMEGKFLYSPSNCASCFVNDANVVS